MSEREGTAGGGNEYVYGAGLAWAGEKMLEKRRNKALTRSSPENILPPQDFAARGATCTATDPAFELFLSIFCLMLSLVLFHIDSRIFFKRSNSKQFANN